MNTSSFPFVKSQDESDSSLDSPVLIGECCFTQGLTIFTGLFTSSSCKQSGALYFKLFSLLETTASKIKGN